MKIKAYGVKKMIYVMGIDELNERAAHGEFDAAYCIMRYPRRLARGVIHAPELAPSDELFKRYRGLVRAGNWNARTFREIYLPTFLWELRYGKEAKQATELLNKIYLMAKAGKNVALACSCGDERLCHRSIIAGLMQGCGRGLDVETASNNYYGWYYDMYLQA